MISSATRYSQSPIEETNSPTSRRVRRPLASRRRYADRTPRTPLPSLRPTGASRTTDLVAHFTVGASASTLTRARSGREPVATSGSPGPAAATGQGEHDDGDDPQRAPCYRRARYREHAR